jgi:ApbE superfamily uncharacterized protein (UPF0280 family)
VTPGGAQARLLADGQRLHLQHGPIDIIAEAFGSAEEVATAYGQAGDRFSHILTPLVAELDLLRRPVGKDLPVARDPVAERMVRAVWPHRPQHITPMAAVAGAVADETLAAMVAGRRLTRAYANNGGDIALFLSPGATFTTGVVNDANAPNLDATIELAADQPSRGLATSGWRGRSHSLGIADAVTVLARNAAAADAAATLIANAVTIEHATIERTPASTLDPDTDLGDRLVTVAVPPLPDTAVHAALNAGLTEAREMRVSGLIDDAYLALQGEVRTLGTGLHAPLAVAS